MSARLMKKVLKEKEAALQQHQQLNSDDDAESLNSSSPNRNPFDLLEDEDNNSSGDHSSHHQEKSKISGEASDRGTSKQSAIAVNSVPMPNVKAKKKKKKKKIMEDLSPRTENEVISSELMLEGLTLGASSSGHQKIAPYPATSQFVNKDSDNRTPKKHCNSSILQVDPKFLSAENELRRIFGSRVVKSHERSQLSVNSRLIRGGRRGNHNLKKTVLVSASQHWPRWDGSLTMELLESKDGVHYFRYIHSSYAQAQRAFEAAKAIHDLKGIASILLNHPYHIDSLITLADYFKFTGEHQMSADAIAKCLYAMECAWHPLFAPSQNCQLKYIHDSNKPFFSSLFTHMRNMDRHGCHRSALEICKFLLSLDSDDPMGAMLSIDYYALRAEKYAWFEQFAEEFRSDNSLWPFPNFSYSLAISPFYLEKRELLNNREMVIRKAASCHLMKQALMLHPSVLKKLVVKVPLKDRIWTTLLENSFFQSEQTGSPSLDHLIAIYVERSYIIWRLPDLHKFLSDSALSVIEMLKEKGSHVKDWACVRKEAFPSEKNEYGHLLVSDFSDSMPTMPPDNLQDFMVDQMGEIENREQFHNIPENHTPRDLTNRNALAVLLESMLPWINYGTGDGEHVQHDLPEQVNEE